MPPAENEGHRGQAMASDGFYPEGGRAMVTVRIQMEDGTVTYEFLWLEVAEDFAERAVHIKGVVQVSINGDNLLPETFVMPGGA